MLKCKYNEDCSKYPACGRMCGKSLEELLWHKCQVIRDMEQTMADARFVIKCIEGDARRASNILYKLPYIPTCPYGYTDCISDPAYIRCYHSERWEKLGMPTECSSAKYYEKACSCKWYDDEDK